MVRLPIDEALRFVARYHLPGVLLFRGLMKRQESRCLTPGSASQRQPLPVCSVARCDNGPKVLDKRINGVSAGKPTLGLLSLRTRVYYLADPA